MDLGQLTAVYCPVHEQTWNTTVEPLIMDTLYKRHFSDPVLTSQEHLHISIQSSVSFIRRFHSMCTPNYLVFVLEPNIAWLLVLLCRHVYIMLLSLRVCGSMYNISRPTAESRYKEHPQYEILDTTNTPSEPSPIEHCTFRHTNSPYCEQIL